MAERAEEAGESEASELALAVKKNALLLEKMAMLKAAYASKNDELHAERARLAAALAKVRC
jgi:hypothetical protein